MRDVKRNAISGIISIEGLKGYDSLHDSKFVSELKDAYMNDSCKVLPNALWKTLDRLDKLECKLPQPEDGVKNLEGWDNNGLHIYWNEDGEIDSTIIHRVENSNFAIFHSCYFQNIRCQNFSLIKRYFRIKHDCKEMNEYSLGERFYMLNVDIETELNEVSALIGKCYKDIHPSTETVGGWTKSRVFNKNLWIWIMDKLTNLPVALGIADLDISVPEGSLEWIQVLPEYQGSGLGKVLVLELLNRMKGKVSFVTVSGEVDNQTNPERLYRSCGFCGDDVWWLMRK